MNAHEKLVKKARAWLLRDHSVVISEMASIGEQADAIGFSTSGSTVIECKATRSDFLADLKKHFRRFPEMGMGSVRFYLTPWGRGIIRIHELPTGWGLLELRGERVYRTQESGPFHKNAKAEIDLLISALRRVDGHGQGVSVKHYVNESRNRAVIITTREGQA